MARPLWSGSLSFGLVNVPVVLFSAVRDRGIHFRQLHEPDHAPIETRRVCAKDGQEVPWDQVVKGYELDDGRWVLLSDSDLEAAAPRKSKTIDIERFVAEDEIDPLYYEHAYLLAPRDEEGAVRAYDLLTKTLASQRSAAVGRFVMRARELLVSIRSREGGLTLSTMRFHDEIRSREEVAAELATVKASRTQVEHATAVIGELSVDFDPSRYHDEHRANLRRIIESKRKGQKIEAPPAEEEPAATTGPDLVGALEESLARIRAEGGPRHDGRSRRASSPRTASRRGGAPRGG
jgi:DNA end-binding protein Ku